MSDMVLPAIIEGTGGMETRTVTLHVRNDDGQIDCEFHIKISRKPVQIAPIPEFEWVDGTPFATVDLGAFFANEKTFSADGLPDGFAVSPDGKLTGPA